MDRDPRNPHDWEDCIAPDTQEEVDSMFCTICSRMMFEIPGKGYVCPEHG